METKLIRGTLLDVQRLSSTHVWGQSAGTYSSSSTKTDFFIRDAAGQEHRVSANLDMPARPGNDVSVVFVRAREDWELALVHNHATDDTWTFDAGWARGFRLFVAWALLIIGVLGGIGGIAALVYEISQYYAYVKRFDYGLAAFGAILLMVSIATIALASSLHKGRGREARVDAERALNHPATSGPKDRNRR